jgi:hypothetical protein
MSSRLIGQRPFTGTSNCGPRSRSTCFTLATALPDEMKRSLLYLAEFVRQTSIKIMGGEGEIADLIEVNQIHHERPWGRCRPGHTAGEGA